MPTLYEPQKEIAIDFIVNLPKSTSSTKGATYTNILTITDRFTKMQHYIPIKLISARNIVRIFLKYVFSRYSLPNYVTSNRGAQFMSDFQKALYELLNIRQRLLSTYYPKTDGQSERSNQIIEGYLRAYVNYSQNDQVNQLPLAKFATNNYVLESIGVIPFYTNEGRHPRFIVDRALDKVKTSTTQVSRPKKLEREQARNFATRLAKLHTKLR